MFRANLHAEQEGCFAWREASWLRSVQRAETAWDGLIASELASGSKSGYAFKLTDCLVGVEGTGNVKYRVVAYPVTANATGVRAFCSDESGMVKVDSGGSVRGCFEHGSAMP